MLDRIREALAGRDSTQITYALIQTSPSYQQIKTYDEAVEPSYVKLNENLEPGKYKLQELQNGNYGEIVWTSEFELDPAEEAQREAQQIREEVRDLKNELSSQGQDGESVPTDPESYERLLRLKKMERDERIEEAVLEMMLQDDKAADQFAGQVAQNLADRIGKGGPSQEPGLDFELDSFTDFALYDAWNNPDKIEKRIESSAAIFREALNARNSRRGDDDADEEEQDEQWRPRDLQFEADMPQTLGDLSTPSPEDLVEQSQEQEREQDPDDGQRSLSEIEDEPGELGEPRIGDVDDADEWEQPATDDNQDNDRDDRGDDQDLDPERCQFVKDDGEQCQNPPQEGSRFCHIESHGLSDTDTAGGGDDPPDPEEIAKEL